MTETWLALPSPPGCRAPDRERLTVLAKALAASKCDPGTVNDVKRNCLSRPDPRVSAAALVLCDLADQGWGIRVSRSGTISVRPPQRSAELHAEKERVRRQELIKRDEQLSQPSVRRFIAEMESPREYRGQFVSIFSLMRDGAELAEALRAARPFSGQAGDLSKIIDPYVEVVRSSDRCPHTGLGLGDIWRYFRHTWTNQYTSIPGRTMLVLVRDRAAPFHPVIGIAALSSAIVQIRERDDWIGWQSEQFLETISKKPTLTVARWITNRLESSLAGLYVADFVEDGLYWPALWDKPSEEAIDLLMDESRSRRKDHHRFVKRTEFKRLGRRDADEWVARAESDLFRSKRALTLANLLRARAALDPFLYPKPTRTGLRAALENSAARRAIASICRQAKAEAVGTEIADLTVCGAIAPYNSLLGGKLVAALSVSPTVVRAYHERYRDYASEIASAMAGRPIRRRTNLVFVGTTSLYGAGSSQYNRIRVPAAVVGGRDDISFRQLGRSRSFGTSHFASETVRALVRVAEQRRTGVRVNSIFGEGVNPKLRKVRDGLDQLDWPSEALLQHGRERIIYGVKLVHNLLPYLMGMDEKPDYIFRKNAGADVCRIAAWWQTRWLSPRIQSEEVLTQVADHRTSRPVSHGARVRLPPIPD